jgi:hypothetical protein
MGALRYKSEFQSIAGHRYVVNIWDDEHEGTAREFCLGPEGFELSYEGSTDDMFKAFIPSRLEFTVNVEDGIAETFITQLAQSEPNRFKIFITDGPATGDGTEYLYWQGFIQGEGISIADEYYPYEVRLAAGDMGYFKDVEYASANLPITGDMTVKDTLLEVLDICGHKDFYTGLAHSFDDILETSVEWRGLGMASGGDSMVLTEINQWTFFEYLKDGKYAYQSCQTVVEELAKIFGARFYQSGGKFRFAQIDNLVESTQDYYVYNLFGLETASGSIDTALTIDRQDLYQMAGGATQFVAGAKYSEREYVFRRNFLEGLNADNATVSRFIGDIKLLNYVIATQTPRFTLRFAIKYRIKEYDGSSLQSPFNGMAFSRYTTPKQGEVDTFNLVPLWRMKLKATGETNNKTYYYSQSASEVINGIENTGLSQYKKLIGTKVNWIQILYQIQAWRPDDALPPEYLHYEIIDEEDYSIGVNEYFDLEYVPYDRVVNVELTLPTVWGNILSQNLKDVEFELKLHRVYNRYFNRWTGSQPSYTTEDIDWSVDNFELIVHGDALEERPETGVKYRASSSTSFRKKIELPSCRVAAVNSRTWHSVRVYTGTAWIDSISWLRPGGSASLLNHLSVREAIAMNRQGIKLYTGSLVSTSESIPKYHNVIVKNSVKYLNLQSTFNARMDEWRNVNMIELVRDGDGLTLETLLSQSGVGGGSSLPGGNYSPNSPTSDSGGGALALPQYEFASGLGGDSYEVINFSLDAASGLDASGVNQTLMVFQDATKLNYPLGFTIDFANNELNFTYPLEDAVLELYYYG